MTNQDRDADRLALADLKLEISEPDERHRGAILISDAVEIPRSAAQTMREKVVALILSAMISQRDPDIFGSSHANKMNRQVAEKFADAILSLTPASSNEVKHD